MVKKVVTKTVTKTVQEESPASRASIMDTGEMVAEEKKVPKKKKMTAREREEILIENFVGLQHAMTNLSIKFGSLSDNISKLLQVFEEAAKNFVSGGRSDDKDMLNKINSLLDQNKTIAKGLVLMEGKLRGRSEALEEAPQQQFQPEGERQRPKPLPSL
ncbi:MAG: hypothetical protein KKF50_05255 [Nanoarchaeota archaeon]|nr:hypothetical protein [Nanoarchaeota archaeon]